MNKKSFYISLYIFLIWRILLAVFVLLGILFIKNGNDFLGGSSSLYNNNPFFWSSSNFDGSYYLRISRYGYEPLTHFFFPLYPFLMHLISKYIFLKVDLLTLQIAGVLISNLFAFLSIWGFYRLLKLDFDDRKTILSLLAFLLFPTSIFLVSVYTESLYLALTVWSFYFLRTKKLFKSSILGALLTATRIVGIALIPAFLFEIDYKKINIKKILYLFSISFGLIIYMIYLFYSTGNPLMFNTHGDNFGEYRSSEIIILPRVFYRYIFKILPNLNYLYFKGTFPILLELSTAFLLLFSTIIGFFKLRKSYWVYLTIGFIMPTLYNSFVSLPRYALVLFPLFILIGNYLSKSDLKTKMIYFATSTILMFVVSVMFSRAIWIS